MSAPEPRQFTRDNPCTKRHLWECFMRNLKPVARPVVEAHAEIGVNAPLYLRRKEYLRLSATKGPDVYSLTPEGIEWLEKGFRNYLTRHPEEKDDFPAECAKFFGAPRAVRRTRIKG